MSYNRGMNKEEVVHIYLASLVAQMAKGKKKKKKSAFNAGDWFDISVWKIFQRRK